MAFGDFTVTRASTKLRIGSNGLYGSVANNVPAFEFNTDGSYRGLLVEPGATNLALRSQEFNTTWGKTDITVTDNSIVAPDGATTADTITEGTANTASIDQSVTVSAGATATFSIFVKAGSGNDFVRLIINDTASFGNRVQTFFRFSTGVLSDTGNMGTATGASASVQALPNGWYRVSLTGAITAVTTYRMAVNSASASGSTTRVNNSVYYLWQAQLETGSVATSPIVTTAGTASRVADNNTLSSASSLIGQSAGYVATTFSFRGAGGTRTIFSVNEDSNNAITARLNSSNELECLISSGGVTQAFFTSSALTANTTYGLVFSYSAGATLVSLNGVQVGTTDTSSTIPATSKVNLGISAAMGGWHNGWFKSLVLGSTALSASSANSLSLSLSQL